MSLELSPKEEKQARQDALQELVDTGVYGSMADAISDCERSGESARRSRGVFSSWMIPPAAVAIAAVAFVGKSSEYDTRSLNPGNNTIHMNASDNLDALHDECYSGDIIPDGSTIRGNSLMVTKSAETVRFMGAGVIVVVEKGVKLDTIQVCGANSDLLMNGEAENVAVLGASARLQVTDGSVGSAVVSGANCIIDGSAIKRLSAPYCSSL